MSDVTPLDQVFNKAEPAPQAPEPVQTGEPEAITPEVAEVLALPLPAVAPPAAEPVKPEEPDKVVKALTAKAMDEVRKRQDEVRRREAAEEKLRSYESQAQKPDAMIDPEGAIQFTVSQLEQKFQSRFLDLSENGAKSRYPDFEEMKTAFFDIMLPENPMLQQQALQQSDPYGWIYNQAKNHTEIKKIGNVTEWQAQKEAEIRAKIEAEYAAKLNAETEKAITKMIPGSLGKNTAAGGNVTQPWAGPTPLNQVLGKRK